MRPRVGFAGLGWIGRHRMKALLESGLVEIAALADVDAAAITEAAALAPAAATCSAFDDLMALDLDGIVIATPTGGHAAQAIAALSRGFSVFCQKPLAGSAARARQVVGQARAANRLLGVDLSYRHVRAMQEVRTLVRDGALGEIFSVDLVFHNAYGPDKPWYYDRTQSGGGCLIDLGIHLVDQLLWLFGAARPRVLSARLFREGRPWTAAGGIEDFVAAQMELPGGAAVSLTCSWRAPAGADAVIGATVMGTLGGARARNVDGSFYDFVAERLDRGHTSVVCAPPDDWGGRAAIAWAQALASGGAFDPACVDQLALSETLDALYEAAGAIPTASSAAESSPSPAGS